MAAGFNFHLELGAQIPLVPLGQGEGVLSEDVGEDEEELHVGELCTRAGSLPRAVRQKAFLVLHHLVSGVLNVGEIHFVTE